MCTPSAWAHTVVTRIEQRFDFQHLILLSGLGHLVARFRLVDSMNENYNRDIHTNPVANFYWVNE